MTKPRIIAVCGGRNFFDYDRVEWVMQTEVRPHIDSDFCIVHGGASGADTMAGKYARTMGVAEIVINAQWKFYPKHIASPLRNGWILKWVTPDLLVAFPGGNGTANMIGQARDLGIPVYEVPHA